MKISGQHNGEFSIFGVKEKSLTIFLIMEFIKLKTGTKCKLTGFLQVSL